MFTDDQKNLLNDKLESSAVKKPTGKFGPKGDYIEGWHAIAEANRIFGFDGWSYRIVDIKECHEPTKNEKGNFGVSFIARVEVSAGGVIREDIGYGSGFAGNIGDAYESATKEAITDSLKRALRSFGNPFGLALYDKSRENVTSETAPAARTETVSADLKPASSAEQKRQLLEIDKDLLDCQSVVDVKRCADIWQTIATRDGWSRDYKLLAKDKFDAKRETFKSVVDDIQDAFPGSIVVNDRVMSTLEAGE